MHLSAWASIRPADAVIADIVTVAVAAVVLTPQHHCMQTYIHRDNQRYTDTPTCPYKPTSRVFFVVVNHVSHVTTIFLQIAPLR